MVVTDGNGLPMGLYLASAQPHELTLVRATFETVREPCRWGRPKKRPQGEIGRAYDSRAFREWLRKKGIKPTIPDDSGGRASQEEAEGRLSGEGRCWLT